MSDISKISLPVDVNGIQTPTEFNIKDANAQPKIGMSTVDTEDVMLVTANEM